MLYVRPAGPSDVESLYQFSLEAGVGLTTLPTDKDLLAEKIAISQAAFVNGNNNGLYLFAMEDSDTKQVVGCCAIKPSVGQEQPFYSYKVSHLSQMSKELAMTMEHRVLHLNNDYQGCTELGTLFLTADYRKNRNGAFLSRSRFLFMAQHTARFSDLVIAELRGISDRSGYSPFWKHLGGHFFAMEFSEADYLAVKDKQFIADLMPKYPVYVTLLSQSAQDVIGVAHNTSNAAKILLEREGFVYKNYIDIFDGGPTVEARLKTIRSIRKSRLLTVAEIVEDLTADLHMLANTKITDFRLCRDKVKKMDGETVNINSATASVLGVNKGDKIRVMEF